MYIQRETIHNVPDSSRSPVVFIHGFPDSPRMFADYYAEAERQQPWLQGRTIYTLAFPNRHTNADKFPSVFEMAQGVMEREFSTQMDALIADSPTGKIIPIVHDWGSIYTWRYIRKTRPQGIEAVVALSVGSSLRFDIWEHGIYALGWYYSVLLCLPYYIRLGFVKRFVANILVRYGGYRSDTAEDIYLDSYHYWDGPIKLFVAPLQLLGILNYKPSFVDFDFPVLFMRSAPDRMASNKAFEALVTERANSHFRIFERTHHWFMHAKKDEVLGEIRTFLADIP